MKISADTLSRPLCRKVSIMQGKVKSVDHNLHFFDEAINIDETSLAKLLITLATFSAALCGADCVQLA